MKKSDLLLLLQDFVEETGMLNYIRIHYTEYRPYKLEIIKNIVIKGINTDLFEVYKNLRNEKGLYYSEKLDFNEAFLVINSDSFWYEEKEIYEVTFIDTPKYIEILFNANEPKIPDEFLEFIID